MVDVRSSFVCLGCSSLLLVVFWEMWSLEMEDACRVCQRTCLLWLLRVSVPVSRNRRALSLPWSMFDRRFGVPGALFFFWWRAGGAFLGNLVLEMEDACRVCPRLFVVAVAC